MPSGEDEMRKTIAYMAIAAMLTAGAVVAALASRAPAVIAWEMPTPYADGTFHTVNIRTFAEEVAQATDGRLRITVHSNGSLIRHPEIKNAVRADLVPLGEFLLSRLANQHPLFEADAVPFLAADYAQAERLWRVSRPHVEALLAEEGLEVLFSVPWPPQGLYSDQPIRTIEDLRGRRFRAYNSATERLAQLAGAVPTQVEVPDIPQAFATGRVQAMITSPSTGVDSKAWDFVRHYYHTQAWLPRNVVVVSRRALARLAPDQRAALIEAGRAAEARGWTMSRAETAAQLDVLRQHGMRVEDPSPELAEGLRRIGLRIAEEWVEASGPDGRAIFELMASATPGS
jgi:TRAP-type C4-dicarboxylate transport system substrate-binding protein